MGFQKNPTTTAGDLIYCDLTRTGAPGRFARLAPNTSATTQILTMTSSVPSWTTPDTLTYESSKVEGSTSTSNPASDRVGHKVFSMRTEASLLSNSASVEFISNIVNIQVPSDGLYLISARGNINRNNATFSGNATRFYFFVANVNNNILGAPPGIGQIGQKDTFPSTWTTWSSSIPPFIARITATNLIYANGTAVSLTNRTLFLNVYSGSSGGTGVLQSFGFIQAIRIR